MKPRTVSRSVCINYYFYDKNAILRLDDLNLGFPHANQRQAKYDIDTFYAIIAIIMIK